MARLIDADSLIYDLQNNLWDYETVDGISATLVLKQTVKDIRNCPTVDAIPAVHFNALKSLINGEWVDCKLVEEALDIDFATGLKMFNFSRTAEWNPAPMNGQKITTKFRLKNAVDLEVE